MKLHKVLFKGKKKGYVFTKNITFDEVRAVFFPRGFHEKYKYLGSVPWNEDAEVFRAMEALVLYMDSKAKPWWCPRWVLRFLHLFGNDNSIVRVRNVTLANLSKKLTKGYMIVDYKTKWTDYDLRISILGNEDMWFLTNAIEREFYARGLRESKKE